MHAWNLADALDLIARVRADHEALVQGDRRLTWREVEGRASCARTTAGVCW